MERFAGKVAIVTGGASGIGAATAQRLATEGAQVVIADINEDGAQELAGKIGKSAIARWFDAADVESTEAMVEFAASHFGRIDVLHNNAGHVGPDMALDTDVTKVPMELWEKTMAVNLRGYMAGCRFAIPHMARGGGGAIVNTASGSAHVGDNALIAYGTSKGAVVSFTRYVAVQHAAQNIRCNAISPGVIRTPAFEAQAAPVAHLFEKQTLTPRLGKPEDIAAAVAYLASEDAAFVTGQILHVDGGLHSHQPYAADFAELAQGD